MGVRVISVTLVLQGVKPQPKGYPIECKTIGDHIRKNRMNRELSQPELSEILNVSTSTITNWELNRSQPLDINLPLIIDFLGYTPKQPSYIKSLLSNPIFQHRAKHGILLKDLAKKLGVNRGTLSAIEKGIQPKREPIRSIIQSFLNQQE